MGIALRICASTIAARGLVFIFLPRYSDSLAVYILPTECFLVDIFMKRHHKIRSLSKGKCKRPNTALFDDDLNCVLAPRFIFDKPIQAILCHGHG